MRSRIIFGISVLAAFAAAVLLPWLALQEARHQAFNTSAEITRGYAQDVLHRAEETAQQAQEAIQLLATQPDEPCSPAGLALMRRIDLTSTYIQAVGFVRNSVVQCSSMGSAPFELGKAAFRTSAGVTLYLNVPLTEPSKSPLMALERNSFVVLVHRDLPLDTTTSIPGASLAVLHLEAASTSAPELAKGHVDRAWLSALGNRPQTVFTDKQHLVALVRSSRFRIVAVAAIPAAYVDERTAGLARRLVPAGVLAGLALAVAILLLARRQRSLAAAMRYALRHNEFFLLYQPIIELATGRCVGVEALLRWRRTTGELIGPDLFIPVAEQSGIITRLTERVFKLVEADAGAFLARHPDFHIAVNLSAADLQSAAIIDVVDSFLQRSGASSSSLTIEITERGFLDMQHALPVIAALRSRGIAVAIDDFGTGYSSLSYLETVELDILKIDRSFIEAIGTGAPTSQVVGHIIAMAQTLGLRMVAEGVESQAQADFLNQHDVQYAQGWLFGKPMPFRDAAQLAPHGVVAPPKSAA